jgi:hypothetical protein
MSRITNVVSLIVQMKKCTRLYERAELLSIWHGTACDSSTAFEHEGQVLLFHRISRPRDISGRLFRSNAGRSRSEEDHMSMAVIDMQFLKLARALELVSLREYNNSTAFGKYPYRGTNARRKLRQKSQIGGSCAGLIMAPLHRGFGPKAWPTPLRRGYRRYVV